MSVGYCLFKSRLTRASCIDRLITPHFLFIVYVAAVGVIAVKLILLIMINPFLLIYTFRLS